MSAKELATATFDYSKVEPETKGKLIALAGQIKRGREHYNKSIFELGESIAIAHSLFANRGNGSFEVWVESEAQLELSAARNYMRAWERFKDSAIIAGTFRPTAMYMLAAPEAPKAAAKEAVKLANKGEQITVKKAKELLERFKEIQAPKPPTAPTAAPSPAAQPAPAAPQQSAVQEGQPAVKAAEPSDYGKCPNCAGTKWAKDDDGVTCARCHHPHGEPTGGADDDRVSIQRSKTIKTVEALMRAFDDLNMLLARPMHGEAITSCKALLKTAKAWR